MPKDFEGIVNDYSYTQNRELSWLRFNRRVLEEAADDLVPPLERLKFISIFSSNLDEFFMVRVGSLLDLSLVSPDEIDNKSGLDPAEQLQAIYEAIPSLLEIKGQLYSRVSTLLAQAGVQDLTYDDLTAEQERQGGAGLCPLPGVPAADLPAAGKPRALPAAGDDFVPLDADPLQKIHGGGALCHQRHPQRRPELRPGKI